jgi:leucyl-tRNA synthetase
MPVDMYTGGAEHAVMHLFYARFFIKALRDMGLLSFGEPFLRLFNQGTIIAQKQKMSKSRGNVVTPDDYVSKLGADTVRAYLMFVAPWEQGGEWNDSGISGISRWLNRLWKLVLEEYEQKIPELVLKKLADEEVDIKQSERELKRVTHQTVKKVTHDMERLRFNTMIAALMELTNYLAKVKEDGSVSPKEWLKSIDKLVLMLAPAAPHLAEELWQLMGHGYSIHNQPWPEWDEELAREDEITLVVQINGKVRDKITLSASVTEEEARELVLKRQKVMSYLEGKQVVKSVYVPKRLINIVVR